MMTNRSLLPRTKETLENHMGGTTRDALMMPRQRSRSAGHDDEVGADIKDCDEESRSDVLRKAVDS
jgi:hypothetical protein